MNVPIFERFSCEEVPQNFEEGKKLQYRDECLAAVTEKFQLFNKEQDLASLWESKKVERSGVRWVFALDTGLNVEIVKYKAHFVARIFNQLFDVDYLETFAP